MAAKNPIDFADYISNEALLRDAARSVRALGKAVTETASSVNADGARIKAGIEQINSALKDGQATVAVNAEKKSLQELSREVSQLLKAKQELQQQDKAGAVIQKTLTDAASAAATALKEQQAAFKAAAASGDTEAQKKAAAAILEIKASADQAGRAIRGANSEFTAATGSINELRLQLSKGTAAYNALSASERDNSEAGKKLRDSNKALSDQLKTLEKGIGDTRRNVGNYGDAFREAAQNGILPFSSQINNAIQTADQLKDGLASARTALFGVKEGGVVAGEGLKIVKLGIAATGIGFFLIALTTLYEYFTKSDDGAEDLAAGLAYLKGVFSVLEGAVVSVGRSLNNLVFKDTKGEALDLADSIKTRLTDAVKGYGVLLKGLGTADLKGIADGFVQIATGTTKATDKVSAFINNTKEAAAIARDLSRAGDELEDLEISAIALNEKQSQLASKLVLTAKDRNLTEAQRLTNLDKAGQLETSVLNRNLEIENKRFKILKDTNAEAKRRGVLQDDDRRAQEEQQAKLFRLQGEYEQQQQVIANRRSVLQKTEREEEARLAKEAREKELDGQRELVLERQVQIQRGLLAVQKGTEAELALKKQLLQAGRDLELINDKLSANGRLLIKEKELVDEKALAEDFAKQQAEFAARDLERRKKLASDIQGIVDKAYQDELKALQDSEKTKEAALKEQYATGEITQAEYQQRLRDLKQRALEEELRLDEKYAKDTGDVQERIADKAIEEAERARDKRQRITRLAAEGVNLIESTAFEFRSQQLDAEQEKLKASYDQDVKNAGDNQQLKAVLAEQFDKRTRALKRQQAINDRENALFQIALNTAVQASQYTPLNPLFYLAIASGLAQAAIVLSKPLPAYFKGRENGPAEYALVAERGPELIESRGKFRYVAEQGIEYLNAGDKVHTAEKTQQLLDGAHADMRQLEQPLSFGRNLATSTAAIQAGRAPAPNTDMRAMRKAIEANTAAMKTLKQVTVNVNGEVTGALVKHGSNLAQSLNQRLINYGN